MKRHHSYQCVRAELPLLHRMVSASTVGLTVDMVAPKWWGGACAGFNGIDDGLTADPDHALAGFYVVFMAVFTPEISPTCGT